MKSIIVLFLVALPLVGCVGTRNERMAQGAGVGAVGGAVIGGVASRSVGGAVVGGVAGGAVGAVVGSASGRHDHRCYRDRYNQNSCNKR